MSVEVFFYVFFGEFPFLVEFDDALENLSDFRCIKIPFGFLAHKIKDFGVPQKFLWEFLRGFGVCMSLVVGYRWVWFVFEVVYDEIGEAC